MTNFLLKLLILGSLLPTLAQAKCKVQGFSDQEVTNALTKELIVKTKDLGQGPWPQVTILMPVKATSLEAVSMFAAYDHQKHYVPNLLKSDVIKQVGGREVHTEYEMKMPWPINNSKYVHGTIIDRLAIKDAYQVQWFMVRSNSADKVFGTAIFSSCNGQTLMRYQSFMKPKSALAGLFKGSMIKDVKASLKAIVGYTEKVSKTNPELLKKYVHIFEKSLSGENIYTNK
jgi:hypothetical protein